MLTNEQLAEVRARYVAATETFNSMPMSEFKMHQIYVVAKSQDDIRALLDEITRLRGEIEKANLYALETCDYGHVCSDRDKWKARAEKAEAELHKLKFAASFDIPPVRQEMGG